MFQKFKTCGIFQANQYELPRTWNVAVEAHVLVYLNLQRNLFRFISIASNIFTQMHLSFLTYFRHRLCHFKIHNHKFSNHCLKMPKSRKWNQEITKHALNNLIIAAEYFLPKMDVFSFFFTKICPLTFPLLFFFYYIFHFLQPQLVIRLSRGLVENQFCPWEVR